MEETIETYTAADVVQLIKLALVYRSQPWSLFGYTEQEWDDMGSHERGEDLDHWLDQHPEIEAAVNALRAQNA